MGLVLLLCLADFLAQTEIECSPQNRNGGQLAYLIPAWGHSGGKNIGGQLQFQRQGKATGKAQPHCRILRRPGMQATLQITQACQ